MLYYVKGSLVLNEDQRIAIDVGGVAYLMSVSANTQSYIATKSFNGENEVKLFTHFSVREDGIDLFGFKDTEELNMFKLLVSVSGIGPKAAMALLSFMTPEQISKSIYSDDKRSISKAPGIGPKTAARIILELKDKVGFVSSINNDSDTITTPTPHSTNKYKEALDALTVLGFTGSSSSEALKNIDIDNLELEEIIKQSLKKLMK